MLRITIHDRPESVTFQLEGGLAGSWVGEVENCRQRTPRPITLDQVAAIGRLPSARRLL